MVGKNKLGLIVGAFLSFVHLIWCLAIAISTTGMQKFLDRIFSLHYLNPAYIINPAYVTFLNGLILVVLTFVMGYILGWILGLLGSYIVKK